MNTTNENSSTAAHGGKLEVELRHMEPPTHIGELPALMQLAKELVPTGFLPDHIKTPGQAVAIILAGRELGIGPMLALRSIYMLKGKVELSADLQLSLFKRDGGQAVFQTLTEAKATLKFTHPNGDTHIEEFTIEDARRAGLVRPQSNWTNYPKAMLRSRVITAGLKSVGFEPKMSGCYAPGEIGGPETVELEVLSDESSRPTAQPTPSASPKPVQQTADGASPLPKGKTVETLLVASRKKVIEEFGKMLLPQVWVALLRRAAIMDNERIEAATETGLFPTASKFCGELQTTATYETACKALKGDHQRLMEEIKMVRPTDDEARSFDAVYGNQGAGNEEPAKPDQREAVGIPTTCPKCQSTATKTSKDYDLISWCEACGAQWGEGGKAWEAHPWASIICPIPTKGTPKKEYDKAPLTLGQIMRTDNKRFYGLVMNNQEAKGWTDNSGKHHEPSKADLTFAGACKEAVAYMEANKTGAVEAMRDGADAEPDNVPFN